jgi:membrane protein YdbS with pleckstrin-like domain
MSKLKKDNSGLVMEVISIVAAIIIIVIGAIILSALYPVSPFMAIVGMILLLVVAIVIVLGFVKDIFGG